MAAASASASIASSLVSLDSRLMAPSNSASKQSDRPPLLRQLRSLHLKHLRHGKVGAATSYRNRITVRSGPGDNEGPGTASIFVGGFVLGGLMVGTLACVYAPQISKALAETDRKDLMRKLPKFIYDEEKALEKTRKVLTEKIAQLNAAIDDVSSQLRVDDGGPNDVASHEVEVTT